VKGSPVFVAEVADWNCGMGQRAGRRSVKRKKKRNSNKKYWY
jgi:hypothetical protein